MSSLYSSTQLPRDASQKLMSSKTFNTGIGKYMRSTLVSQLLGLPKDRLEFIDDDGFKVAQHVLENSKGLLGTCQNATELTSEVNNFVDFIGNFDFLKMEYCEPYNHTVNVYKNLKDEEFIHRKDLFPLIQSMILHCVPDMRYDITISVLSVFLRIKEKKMGGGYTEFIKYSDDILLDLSKVLHSEDFKQKLNDVPQGKRVIPLNKTAALKLWYNFGSDVDMILHDAPGFMSGFYNQDVYWKCQVTLEVINKFIASRDDLFSSNTRYRTVRLFEDGGERFVFNNELAMALNKTYTDQNDMKMMTVQDQFLERLPHIEFIRTPIVRSKNRAVPIITPNSQYSVLASDGLIELLHQLIDIQLFKFASPEATKLALNAIDSVFCGNGKIKSCCDFSAYEALSTSVYKILMKDKTIRIRHKTFQMPSEFTEDILREVVENVGLTDVFPNIQNYVQTAFEYVDSQKSTETLTTVDLYKCLEICQMLSIMEMTPNIKKFLHDQKACKHVIGMGCSECPEISRRSFVPKNITVEQLEINEQVLADEHDDIEHADCETETAEPEQETAIQENNVCAKKNKKIRAKKQPSVDKPSTSSSDEGVDSADEMRAHKLSNTCEKCFRTSERCNQVKEKLKEEKTKIKQLIKNQKETENKISQMQQRHMVEIEEKDSKIQEKDAKLQEKDAKIQEKDAKLQEKDAKLQEKDAKIQELMAQLAAFQSSQQVTSVVVETPVETPERTELTQEMKDALFEFQAKRNTILNDNPMPEMSSKAHRLQTRATDKNDKMGAQMELKEICDKYEQYMNALEENIKRIQSNVNISSSDLLEIPDFPSLSSGFLEAYERVITKPDEEKETAAAAKKKKEEEEDESENECQICCNDMTPSEETLKCPHCPKTYHSSCISEWINKSPTCPNCRGKFLNPTEYPPLS